MGMKETKGAWKRNLSTMVIVDEFQTFPRLSTVKDEEKPFENSGIYLG